MIAIERFDDRPVVAGDVREIMLSGDGPFAISPRCFVDKPAPPGPGFLPCPECRTKFVRAGEMAKINISPDLWIGKEGELIIDISNRLGETIELKILVQSVSDSTPTATASY